MKLHHTEYKKNYKQYILDQLGTEDALIGKDFSDDEKIDYLFDRFNNEYGFMIDRVGKQKALAEWLSGLAINIEYTDNAIIQLAEEMGSIEPNPTEKMQDIVINGYWSFMANVILSFEPNKEVA
tara:strand:- start:166 stop:537 length:372 start_codon:yes stop_codon:yes gene_type:complete